MLNVLVPAAGSGTRFREAGYARPKPLVEAGGVPMLKRVIDNVAGSVGDDPHRFIFVVQEKDGLVPDIRRWLPGAFVIGLHEKTDGAARTCLMAAMAVDNTDQLLIVNTDQVIDGGFRPLLTQPKDVDAAVLTMHAAGDPKWSYVALTKSGLVGRVAEKDPISDRATCGVYWWRRGRDFVESASRMIRDKFTVNGEHYVAPSLNWLIVRGLKVAEVRVEDYGGVFHGLGTPEDLAEYEKHLWGDK